MPACSKPVDPPVGTGDVSIADPLVSQALAKALEDARQDPTDADVRGNLGMTYHAHSLWEPAATTYRQAIALNGTDAQWHYLLGLVMIEQGALDSALLNLDRVHELDDSYAPAHLRHGDVLFDLGRLDEAAIHYERASAREEANPGGAVGLARIAMQRGDYARAVSHMEGVVQRYPDVGYFRQLLGMALQRAGRMGEAHRHIGLGTGERPQLPDPWVDEMLAKRTGYRAVLEGSQTMLETGRLNEAIALLTDARSRWPEDITLLSYLAQAFGEAGNRDRSVSVLKQALDVDPEAYAIHLNLALEYEHQGQLGRSMEHARRSVEIHPQFGRGHLQVGRLLLMQEKFEEAEPWLADAFKYGVEGLAEKKMYGGVLIQLQRWADARQVFDQLAVRHPEYAPAFAGLAICQAELGHRNRALQAISRAQSLDPTDSMVREATAYLQEMYANE